LGPAKENATRAMHERIERRKNGKDKSSKDMDDS
jgi:hypothetical protein